MPGVTSYQLLQTIQENKQELLDAMKADKKELLDTIKADKQELHGTMEAGKQEVLVAMTEQLGVITDNMVTKDDLNESTNRLDGRLDRIERRIIEGRKVNVQHHLTTRKMLGDLTQEHAALREGIAKAVEAI